MGRTFQQHRLWLIVLAVWSINLLPSKPIHAQNILLIDSLLQQLEVTDGAPKVEVFLRLSEELRFNDPERAMTFANWALQLANSVEDEVGIANAYLSIARLYNNNGNHASAIEFAINALNRYERLADSSGIGKAMLYIGHIYSNEKKVNKSEDQFYKAQRIFEAQGDNTSLAYVYTGLGDNQMLEEDYPDALYYYYKALKMAREVENRYLISLSSMNIGNVHRLEKNYSDALKYYNDAIAIKISIGDRQGEALTYYQMAEVYFVNEDYENAIYYYEKCLKIGSSLNTGNEKKLAYAGLSQAYSAIYDFEKAYQYLNGYIAIKDSLIEENSNKELAEMEARFESEQKRKENELLTKENELQDIQIRNKNITSYALFGGLVLMLILAFVILRAYRHKQRANELLGNQKMQIERKNRDITDSIIYAKQIQSSIFPGEGFIKQLLPNSFIYFKPRDIVSGDFYFLERREGKVMFAVVDCTGHGVPGALISIVGYNQLNQAINEKGLTIPSIILKHMNIGVSEALHHDYDDDEEINDGMDIGLGAIDFNSMKLEYAGAHHSLLLIRNGEIMEFKGARFPVGGSISSIADKKFKNHEIELIEGDLLYLFSDGFSDQFGGPDLKKYKYLRMREFIRSIHTHSMEEQHQLLEREFNNWMGNESQTDDVCIIGIRV